MAMTKRTHMCGEIVTGEVGKQVVLKGWVQRARNLGGLIFVSLRDRTGIVQVVFDSTVLPADVFQLAESLRGEFVVEVRGEVRRRAPEAVNDKMKTGEVEVAATAILLLNTSKTPPIYIEDGTNEQESLRLKYRYLDLRRPSLQAMLRFRHQVIKALREIGRASCRERV